MDELLITAYMTNGHHKALDRAGEKSALETSVADANLTVTARLSPEGGAYITIIPKIIKTGKNPLLCKTPDAVWFEVAETFDAFNMAQSLALKSKIPKSPDFISVSHTGERSGLLHQFTAGVHAAPVPDSSSAAASLYFDQWQINSDTTGAIPGEMIEQICLYHYNMAASFVDWCFTYAMTGGTVTAKRAHASVAELFVYDVDCEGYVITNILPTDFRPYSVGEWVQLIKVTSGGGSLDHTTPHHGDPASSLSAAAFELRVAPIAVS